MRLRSILLTAFAVLAPILAQAGEWDPIPGPTPRPESRSTAPTAPPPPVYVWLEACGGGGTTVEGQGLASRAAISAGFSERRDFLRLRWHYFGERAEKNRHPHADWTSTTGVLYGGHWRNRDALASAAIGLGVTTGFARGKLLYELDPSANGAYRWYRPRRFIAASAIADVFVGAGTNTVAFGITLSGDANAVRQTGSAQATFMFGAIP